MVREQSAPNRQHKTPRKMDLDKDSYSEEAGQGRRSKFLSEGALKIGCGPIWAWSLKFMLMLLRN